MVRKIVKLFGFKLNDTSGLILFIFSLLLLITAGIGLLMIIQVYNNTGVIPVAYLGAELFLFVLAFWIFKKTNDHRNK
jgi:hypothetical protein